MSEWLSAVRLSTHACLSSRGSESERGGRGLKGLPWPQTSVVVVTLESFS